MSVRMKLSHWRRRPLFINHQLVLIQVDIQLDCPSWNTQRISETRYLSYNGGFRRNCAWIHLSLSCAGEYVGLEEIDNGIWNVYFGPLRPARLSEQHMRIEDAYGSLWRHKKKQNV